MNPQDLIPPEYRDAGNTQIHNKAANLIRHKIDNLYAHEPDAQQETKEIDQMISDDESLSKHQKFMKKLSESDLDVAEVQVRWHDYYNSLPDDEKHEVWREFYTEQEVIKKKKAEDQLRLEIQNKPLNKDFPHTKHARDQFHNHERTQKTNQVKEAETQPINIPLIKPTETIVGIPASTKPKNPKQKSAIHRHYNRVKNNHHIKSLAFGLSSGFIVVFILLFSFFNERFIIPFIRPSANVSATPIIATDNSGPVGPEAKIIIPKINLEAPVIYDVPTIEEKDVQAGLEKGVVHYATTPNPGEKGNAVIFGHSSGNILNKGKYKFAFLLLKSLEKSDTFIIQKDSKRYVYKVFNKYVTEPSDISVLGAIPDKIATTTLITCDPPGTSTHRLIIQAEQIYPSPNTNANSSVLSGTVSEPKKLPSNSPSLWQRLFGN